MTSAGRALGLGLAALFLSLSLHANPGKDPLDSPGWRIIAEGELDGADYVFDEAVIVTVPEVAEDSTRVPVHVSVDGIEGIQKLIVVAELNPITRAATVIPEASLSKLGFGLQIKVQQATPIRAAVLDGDGLWHVGGAWISAAGGGCTAPSTASVDPSWSHRLGESGGRLFSREGEGTQRLKFSVIHPMDAGFVASAPRLFVEETTIRSKATGDRLFRLLTTAAVSENPTFSIDLDVDSDLEIQGYDNNGHRYALDVAAH